MAKSDDSTGGRPSEWHVACIGFDPGCEDSAVFGWMSATGQWTPAHCDWRAPCPQCEEQRIWGDESVDPMERVVDGLSVRECLERFTTWQRTRDSQQGGNTVYWIDGQRMVRPWNMSHVQVVAARDAWSAELKRKQAEARENERALVVCERDEEGL